MRDTLVKAGFTALKSLAFLLVLMVFLFFIAVGTEGGTRWTINRVLGLASASAPYQLASANVSGTLLDELVLENFSLSATDGSNLTVAVGNTRLTWNPIALFDSRLHIRNLLLRQVVVDPGQPVQPATEASASDIEAVLQALFALPVAIQVDQVGVQNITLRGQEANQRIASVVVSGGLDGNALDLLLSVNRDRDTRMTATLKLDADLALAAEVDWQARFNELAASGRLEVNGGINDLAVQHRLAAPAVIESSGSIATGLADGSVPELNLRHDLTGLGGAVVGVPMLESLDGSLVTVGTTELLNLTGSLEARLQDFDLILVDFDVVYNITDIQVNALNVDSEMLTAAASGGVSLAQGNAINLQWTLENFTDGELLQNLDLVSLAGTGAVTSTASGNQRLTSLAINDLAGEINTYPLSGSGELNLVDSQVQEIDVTLVAGGNSLALNGAVVPALDLDWSLQAPVLSRILTNLQGQINGQGTFTGSTEAPRINGQVSGSEIGYSQQDFSVQLAKLEGEARYDGTDNRVTVNFNDLLLNQGQRDFEIRTGEVVASGNLQEHELAADIVSSLLNLQVQAIGGYQQSTWTGAIPQLAIQSDYGDWELDETLSVSASAEQASISEHCWSMTSITVCSQAQWTAQAGATGNLMIDNFPLAILNNPDTLATGELDAIAEVLATRPPGLERLMQAYAISLPVNSFVDGRVDLEANFNGLGGDWPATRLSAIISPRDLVLGVVTIPDADSESLAPVVNSYGLDEVLLELRRENAQWSLDTGFQVYILESGGLGFQGGFNGQASMDDDENLAGEFSLAFSDIAWLEALLPNILNPTGMLEASGTIEGDLTRPLLVFDSSLRDGSFNLPEYGLQLRDINLSLHSEQDNQITIDGEAASGDGTIAFNSMLTTPFLVTRTLHLEVGGEQFQIVNVPDTRVSVNPDFVITYDNNLLDITGALEMPVFDLDISNNMALVGNGAVGHSRDVVVVSVPPELENMVDTQAASAFGAVPVTMDIMLTLGEDVRFRGYGLDLTLSGELELEQELERPLLAHGELTTNGNYALYGQRLNIENGKLLFLGNPLNPAVDIRATRSTPSAQVGLMLSGTISNLQGQLVSTPALPEGEILALLITGRSFQNVGNEEGTNMLGAIATLGLEKGQGLTNTVRNGLGLDTVDLNTGGQDFRESALGLGKYLSPRLFMRYDIGLFDRENVLSLDYTLTERLRLEVESGVSQSVDLTYSVEK